MFGSARLLLPTGDGLLAFSTPEEAVSALAEVEQNYASHCMAARALAEEYFDANTVLPRLLELAMQAQAQDRNPCDP